MPWGAQSGSASLARRTRFGDRWTGECQLRVQQGPGRDDDQGENFGLSVSAEDEGRVRAG